MEVVRKEDVRLPLRVLSVQYGGDIFYVYPIDLDTYQMIDVFRDVKEELCSCGVTPPEYFSFSYSSPMMNRRKPLKNDRDWLALCSEWEGVAGEIRLFLTKGRVPPLYQLSAGEIDTVNVDVPITSNDVGDIGITSNDVGDVVITSNDVGDVLIASNDVVDVPIAIDDVQVVRNKRPDNEMRLRRGKGILEEVGNFRMDMFNESSDDDMELGSLGETSARLTQDNDWEEDEDEDDSVGDSEYNVSEHGGIGPQRKVGRPKKSKPTDEATLI